MRQAISTAPRQRAVAGNAAKAVARYSSWTRPERRPCSTDSREEWTGPGADLVLDASGNLYSTTVYGGGSGCYRNLGCGTVFRFGKTRKETVLHRFTDGADGAAPTGGLILDELGNLYGTTEGSAASYGTVFKLNKDGKETVLHSFGNSDGAYPTARVIQGKKGYLYGTAIWGGDLNCGNGYGCGTVFRLSKSGKLTVLYKFGGPDGSVPWAGVVGSPPRKRRLIIRPRR
jgi:uncharacterized repeat protein (TIGR03803 family)